MTFSAISYPVVAGHDEDITDIFSPANFRRANSPVIRDASGTEIGRIIGTGLFLKGDNMVRVIQYDGELDDVARHMAGQQGVREAERRLAPYLSVPRDTSTPEDFLAYFRCNTMRRLAQQIVDDCPLAGLVALCDTVRSESVAEVVSGAAGAWLAAMLANTTARKVQEDIFLAGAVFLSGTSLVRVLQHAGDSRAAMAALAGGNGPSHERRLSAHLVRPPSSDASDAVTAHLQAASMRCISCLSIASLLPQA